MASIVHAARCAPRMLFAFTVICLAQSVAFVRLSPAQAPLSAQVPPLAPSSREAVGTLRMTGATDALGPRYVLTNERGQAAFLVQQVPGIDLTRYLNQQVVVHGTQQMMPGSGVRSIHPWRIDVVPPS